MFSLYFSYVLALKTIDVQMLFFDGTKQQFLKLKLKKKFCKFSNKNINIWAHWNFFEMKNLTRVRRCVPIFQIWTFKIIPDLWLLDLFCPIKKKIHTPPYLVGTQTRTRLKSRITHPLIEILQYEIIQKKTTGLKMVGICFDFLNCSKRSW